MLMVIRIKQSESWGSGTVASIYQIRDHQSKFINDLREALRFHQSVLGQAPTGMGKTVCGATMVGTASSRGAPVIFMVHRRELLEQTSKTFSRAGIPHTFIASGKHYNPRIRVAIATVGTLANRLNGEVNCPRLFIADEAHHSAAAGWARVINWAKAGGAKIVGLTATPWRLSGEGLRDHFSHMVLGPETGWLIDNGYLSKYRAFAPPEPDLSDVHSRAGDYVSSEIEKVMSSKMIMGDCVEHYMRCARGKKAVLFAVSVNHSKELCARFNEAGISAGHIDAESADAVRKQTIMDFADGKIDVLCNVDLFGEGFDLSSIAEKDVPIEAVIQMRPTQSLSLHLQQLGRALRPKPTPAIILDHAGNLKRHGFPDSPFEWSLDAREKKQTGKSKEIVAKVKQCPKCYYAHEPILTRCPNCLHEYEVGRKLTEVEGELEELTKEQIKLNRLKEQGSAKSLDDLIRLAYRRGYKPGKAEKWAAYVYSARQQKKMQYQDRQYGR